MPINEFGAEVINGFVVIASEWSTAKNVRTIIAVRIDSATTEAAEYVTAVAGPIGVKEWYNGHYFHRAHDSNAFEKAVADYRSR